VSDKTSEAYWNFDFTDMGVKDLPAFFHTINVVAPAPLQVIGYDIGNMQMFYGLIQLEKFYFGGNISSFIAMAPCVLPEPQAYEGVFDFRALGVYAVNGPNWKTDLEKICDKLSK